MLIAAAENVDVAARAGTSSMSKSPGRPWPPGVSGNPSGRPKYRLPNGKSVAEVARDMTPKALQLLARVVDDEQQPLPLRLGAAQALLRCGWADRPPTVVDPNPIEVIVTTQVIDPDAPRIPGVIRMPWDPPPAAAVTSMQPERAVAVAPVDPPRPCEEPTVQQDLDSHDAVERRLLKQFNRW